MTEPKAPEVTPEPRKIENPATKDSVMTVVFLDDEDGYISDIAAFKGDLTLEQLDDKIEALGDKVDFTSEDANIILKMKAGSIGVLTSVAEDVEIKYY